MKAVHSQPKNVELGVSDSSSCPHRTFLTPLPGTQQHLYWDLTGVMAGHAEIVKATRLSCRKIFLSLTKQASAVFLKLDKTV